MLEAEAATLIAREVRAARPAGRRSDARRARRSSGSIDECLKRDDHAQPPSTAGSSASCCPAWRFKAVVIGGGYATGRELAEFFLPAAARGRAAGDRCSRRCSSACLSRSPSFSRGACRHSTIRASSSSCSGPAGSLFELAYLLFVVLILAVYGAAAGAIGDAVFGAPEWAGTVALMAGIAGVVAFGNKAVERLFRDVSYLLYGVYALFIVLAFAKLRRPHRRRLRGASRKPPAGRWAASPMSSYNIIGAVVILPVLRHLTSDRDAVIAGRDRRAADDASGAAVLHPDGRFLSRSSRAPPCRPISCCSRWASRPSTCCSR